MALRKEDLQKVDDYTWEIPERYRSDMRVRGRVFASEKILGNILADESLEQVVNVSTLPGIERWSLAMPDIHEGYGFPVGGVAAFDLREGIISPGGIGFDINCGVRVIKTGTNYGEVKEKIPKLAEALYREVPSGVGRGGFLKLNTKELDEVLKNGAEQMLKWGFARDDDLLHCESGGRLEDADPGAVSKKAKQRGSDQIGTLGAGNHFVEVQRIDKIFYKEAADCLGLKENDITIMIHCGSRGLGHQVATDYIQEMLSSASKYGIELVDKQLACAPVDSLEGKRYWQAMSAAANFAWANRQLITHNVRQAWEKVFGKNTAENLELIYDVAHNIAKREEYYGKKVVVHRKGATRSFPPHHPETPKNYKDVGQPVLIPGSMGTASYVLVGQPGAMEKSFGSSCHGAGRVMSRTKAKKTIWGKDLKKELEAKEITVMAGSLAGLAEEAPLAYKDVEEVVMVVERVGLARRVARLRPVGVIKG